MRTSELLRRNKILMIVVCLLSFGIYAQAQTVTSRWKGVDASKLNGTETVYLFNLGQSKFVIYGSTWGTKATLQYPDYGVGFKVTHDSNNGYLFDSEMSNTSGEGGTGKYLSLVLKGHGTDSGDPIDWGYYLDREGTYRFTLTPVSGTASDTYVYTLSQTLGSTYYMTANSDGTSIDYSTTKPTTAAGYWVIVPQTEILSALENETLADAYGGLNADATYLVADQNFSRNNAGFSNWTQESTGETSYTPLRFDWRSGSTTTDSWNKLVATKEWGGNDEKNNKENAQYSNVSIEGQGKFYHTISSVPFTGWYSIQCQGFYAGENAANMYVTVTNTTNNVSETHTVNLINATDDFALADYKAKRTTVQTRNSSLGLTAGQAFYHNGSNDTYINQLYFYAIKGNTITVGINKPDATKSDIDTYTYFYDYYHDLDYVAVDNFQLKFFGVSPVVFDETEKSTDYLDKQSSITAKGTNVNTMLKRSFTIDQWNTIVLPIDLSSAQLKYAFGDTPNAVELAKLTGVNGTVMQFESVDLTTDKTNALEANKLYLIKPHKSPAGESITVNKEYGLTIKGPFYNLGRHDFSSFTKPDGAELTNPAKDGVQAHGTYIKTTCPKGSYVLSKGDMYYITRDAGNTIKGFRCWFTYDKGGTSSAKKMAITIDGQDDPTLPTGIEDIIINSDGQQPADIYNVDGQLVRRNATSLEGLPKGIYITRGKKLIVK